MVIFTEKQLLEMSNSDLITRFLELQNKVLEMDRQNSVRIRNIGNAGVVANENRKKQAMSKIKGAVDFLKFSGQKVTLKEISDYAKVSVVTIRKYREHFGY